MTLRILHLDPKKLPRNDQGDELWGTIFKFDFGLWSALKSLSTILSHGNQHVTAYLISEGVDISEERYK